MRKRYPAILLSIALIGSLASGCGKTNDVTSLLETPTVYGEEQNRVETVIKEYLPVEAQYVTARDDLQKQSIFTEDINQDGTAEIFVLYRDLKDNQQIRLLMLQETEGNYQKSFDEGLSINSLLTFRISDLTGSGNKEILIGGTNSENDTLNQLFIYEYDGSKLKKKIDRNYEGMDIWDYNRDKSPEVLLLDGEAGKEQRAELLKYQKGQLEVISTLTLNPDVSFENIVPGNLSGGERALFADGGIGAHSMLTQIITYEDGKLVKIGDDQDKTLFKAYPAYSRDINQDGVIEVAGMYIPKGYEDAAFAEIPFIYTYVDYDMDGTTKLIEERYEDHGQQFFIKIPKEWNEKVTVKKSENGVSLLSTEDDSLLFEVSWTAKAAEFDGVKLAETENTIFYTKEKVNLPIPKDAFQLFTEELD
jgi:hypothetical protein